ncbi:T9SS type A sorting domain-containing protein [Flavobacterium sp. Sd200]|uniref:T9SS type A sorting domain-containing protein n=1 Tax=Flavobacterium sp. Sd200 TaxID=2692211 RepID=UPI001368CB62|nr:T9SS type A sorting domain-containing protein [Flavobacterium sp. Sd200]MXN91534.1 T9SS type A sorting domain-containing protein [Flavobacterium sp. Sd200]
MKKNTLYKFALSAFLLWAPLSLSAQEPKAFGKPVSANPENGLIRCATTQYETYLQEQNPKRETREHFEEWLAQKIQQKRTQRTAADITGVIRIPVVVHVIHNGDAVGSGENISDAQILSQITVLNQDYRRMAGTPGHNTIAVGADMEIEFVMAQTDPNGNLTNGIDRRNLGRESWTTYNSMEATLKPQTSWDPTKYFNIWVCRFGANTSDETYDLLGYAQFPTSSTLGGIDDDIDGGPDNTDGVLIGFEYFGSATLAPNGNYGDSDNVYRYGRTATHEIGHCLGLLHISGDDFSFSSCTVNAQDSTKDYCPDTPATRRYNYGCTPGNSCTASPGNDMIENYMEYTDDSCMNVFTQDQKNRMRTVMENSPNRVDLLTSTVMNPPSASVAKFSILNGLHLYPNPVQNVLNINVSTNALPDSYTVYNSIGQAVGSAKITSEANLTLDTSNYSNGVYFIKVDAGKQSRTLKFVKN